MTKESFENMMKDIMSLSDSMGAAKSGFNETLNQIGFPLFLLSASNNSSDDIKFLSKNLMASGVKISNAMKTLQEDLPSWYKSAYNLLALIQQEER